jgi:hypothetical protein
MFSLECRGQSQQVRTCMSTCSESACTTSGKGNTSLCTSLAHKSESGLLIDVGGHWCSDRTSSYLQIAKVFLCN